MNRPERSEGPMWVIGIITPYGEVCASAYEGGNSPIHTDVERLQGRPFRWNVWSQEYHPSVWHGAIRMAPDREEIDIINDWLIREGWQDTPDQASGGDGERKGEGEAEAK